MSHLTSPCRTHLAPFVELPSDPAVLFMFRPGTLGAGGWAGGPTGVSPEAGRGLSIPWQAPPLSQPLLSPKGSGHRARLAQGRPSWAPASPREPRRAQPSPLIIFLANEHLKTSLSSSGGPLGCWGQGSSMDQMSPTVGGISTPTSRREEMGLGRGAILPVSLQGRKLGLGQTVRVVVKFTTWQSTGRA